MESWIIRTKNLKKYYQLGEHTVKALDGMDFLVREREFVAVIGTSGSGKSTLLHMVGGLDVPTGGEVYVAGRNLNEMNKEQLAVFRRRKVGFVFQNYNLVPDLNVFENVVLPVELDGRHVDREFAEEMLKAEELSELDTLFCLQLLGQEHPVGLPALAAYVRRRDKKKLKELSQKLAPKKVELLVTDGAKRHVQKAGITNEYGAREIDRVIDREIKPLLAERLLFGKLRRGGRCRLDVRDGKLVVEEGT